MNHAVMPDCMRDITDVAVSKLGAAGAYPVWPTRPSRLRDSTSATCLCDPIAPMVTRCDEHRTHPLLGVTRCEEGQTERQAVPASAPTCVLFGLWMMLSATRSTASHHRSGKARTGACAVRRALRRRSSRLGL